MSKPARNAECHPDRPNKARGLCGSCYAKTPARKETQRTYQRSPARKVAQRTYSQTPTRKAARQIYAQTPARKAVARAHDLTPGRRAKRLERTRRPDVMAKTAARLRSDASHDRYTQRKYGLAPGQYAEMLAAQDGRCAICTKVARTRRLAVDHDHLTKLPRGALLCWTCNKNLGQWEGDPIALYNLVQYAQGIIDDLGGLSQPGLPKTSPVGSGRLTPIRLHRAGL